MITKYYEISYFGVNFHRKSTFYLLLKSSKFGLRILKNHYKNDPFPRRFQDLYSGRNKIDFLKLTSALSKVAGEFTNHVGKCGGGGLLLCLLYLIRAI